MAYTFVKRVGAPAGTVHIEFADATFLIDDGANNTISVTDPQQAGELANHPYLTQTGIGGPYTPPHQFQQVMMVDGVICALDGNGNYQPLSALVGPAGVGATFTGPYIGTRAYQIGDASLGSDLNWYVSTTNSNVGHDPVTDGNVHWSNINGPNVITSNSTDSMFPQHVKLDVTDIDMCRAWGIYAASNPGDDVSAKLQAIINYAQTAGTGIAAYFSKAGTYYINGNMQPGTAFGNNYNSQILFPGQPLGGAPTLPIKIKGCGTTATLGGDAAPVNNVTLQSNWAPVSSAIASGTGTQIGSLASFNVTSTAGMPSAGQVNVPTSGGQAELAYTSISSNTLQGVSVVSGTSTWTLSAGNAITTGSVFGVIPGGIGGGGFFSNVCAIFEDINIKLNTADPQANIVNMKWANKIYTERANFVTTNGNWNSVAYTNTLVAAVVMPTVSNSGFQTMRDTVVQGMPHGYKLGEHGNLEGYTTARFCMNAFTGGGGGVQNWISNANVPSCQTLLNAPNAASTSIIIGNFHLESALTQNGQLLVNDPLNVLSGRITVKIGAGYSAPGTLPQKGGQNLDVVLLPAATQSTWRINNMATERGAGGGWMSMQPIDNFLRASVETDTAAIPGATCPTNHPYFVNQGTFTRSQGVGAQNGVLQSTSAASTAQAFVPVVGNGRSRRASADITTQAGAYNFFLYMHYIYSGTNNAKSVNLQVNGGNIKLIVAGTTVHTISSVVAANTSYTVDLSLTYNGRGLPSRARVYLAGKYTAWQGTWLVGTTYNAGDGVGGSDGRVYVSNAGGNVGFDPTTDKGVHWTDITTRQIADYRITEAQRELLIPYNDTATMSWLYDGFGFGSDTGTQLTGFRVREATETFEPNHMGQTNFIVQSGGGTQVIDPNYRLTRIRVDDATAFNLGAPAPWVTTLTGTTAAIAVEVNNNSGGVMGAMTINTGTAGTWNLGGLTWAVPASTKSKMIQAIWNDRLSRWQIVSISADY